MIFNEEVKTALENNQPIVALESTVIAHGLPFPHNLETARSLEKIVRANGAIPATIAVLTANSASD
jgi:pseudouridylate synthase